MKNNIKHTISLNRFRITVALLACFITISTISAIYLFNKNKKITANEKQEKEIELNALQEKREAVIQNKIATQQQQIAEQLAFITNQQKSNALKQMRIAEDERQLAQNEKKRADRARLDAEAEKNEKEIQRLETEKQRQEALTQKDNVYAQKMIAEASEKKTQQLRLLLMAKTLALQSVKLHNTGEKGDVPGLLAMQAYQFNKENDGSDNDPDIFNALSGIADDKVALTGFKDAVRSISLSKNGNILAACSDDKTVLVWSKSNNLFQAPHKLFTGAANEEMRCVALSEDCSYLMAGTAYGNVLLWNLSKKTKEPQIVKISDAVVNKIVFMPAVNIFISVSADGNISAWKPEAFGKPFFTCHERFNIKCIAGFNNKFVTGNEKGTVSVYNAESPALPPTVFQAEKSEIISIATEGNLIASGCITGSIKVWDVSTISSNPVPKYKIIGHTAGVTSLCFYPWAKKNPLLASASYDKTIRIWSLLHTDDNPIVIRDNDSWVMDIAYSVSDRSLISAGADNTIKIFNTDQVDMANKICNKVKRNFTNEEWAYYIGKDIKYIKTCKDKISSD